MPSNRTLPAALAFISACAALMDCVAVAADRPADQHSARGIVLSQCRITLIDELTLSSERAGVLEFVANEGAVVGAGELAAQIRDDLAQATAAIIQEQAVNDIDIRFARGASELAQLEYERDLAANRINAGTVPELTVRGHRLAAEKALLQLEQAEHNLRIEKLRLNESQEILRTFRVESPLQAVVRHVHKKPGETVREGEAIVDLVNTDRVRVEGYLPVANVHAVRLGSYVRVQLEQGGAASQTEQTSFEGRIAFIDVKIEPLTNRVKIWAEVANRDDILRDGLTATMTIDPTRIDAAFAASRRARPSQRE